MRLKSPLIVAFVLSATVLGVVPPCGAQTPEQVKLWDTQRAAAAAAAEARAAQLERDRAARKANPMGWVGTLDPMSSGGWEFRSVANDGSWAAYGTEHQMKRSGRIVTLWLRQEFAEPQADPHGGSYLSFVQRLEFDCDKDRLRPRQLIYYAENNLRGATQSLDMDPKTTQWGSIVPGTLYETTYQWACNTKRRR